MTIPIQRVFNQVLGQLNANASDYGGASEKPEYRDEEVMDAMLVEEYNIFAGIGRAVRHGRRVNIAGDSPLTLVQDVDVAYGAQVPTHIGPVLEVEINGLFAQPLDVDTVRDLRDRNVLKLTLKDGYYGFKDGFLYFTGTSPAKVTLFNYTRPTFADLDAFLAGTSKLEPEFEGIWVDLTVGRVMPREGAFLQAAGVYTQRGLTMLGGLLGEQVTK